MEKALSETDFGQYPATLASATPTTNLSQAAPTSAITDVIQAASTAKDVLTAQRGILGGVAMGVGV
ncbi:hypothetical protein HDU76_002436, partial [Blyttiomyces sp. JEL0837]